MGFGETVQDKSISAVGTSVELLAQVRGQKQDRALSEFSERELIRRAETTREAATEEQFFARQDLRQTVARNRALAAKGGNRAVGSPLMANILATENAARNIATIGFNADRRASGFESQARGLSFERSLSEGTNRLGLLSTAIGGVRRFRRAGHEADKRSDKSKGTIAAEKKVRLIDPFGPS